jgi:Regulator of polyketide synthase expression
MKLSLNILLDELANFSPYVHKSSSNNLHFEQIYYLNAQMSDFDPSILYICTSEMLSMVLGHNYPNNLLVLGNDMPAIDIDNSNTLIQISGPISLDELFQYIANIFLSYEHWKHSLLLTIIQHKSISEFLRISADKLANPIAFFDNSLALIAKAGTFTGSCQGTIWESVEHSGYAPTDFYTLKEQHDIAKLSLDTSRPNVYHTLNDKEHTYVSTQIQVKNKAYGALGLVDINSPFTDGQLDIIQHITETLKLYIQNNESTMLALENETSILTNILDGIPVSEEALTHHFKRLQWSKHDYFYILKFTSSIPFDIPIRCLPYIKRIRNIFPLSFIINYNNSIIMILRRADYSLKEKTINEKLQEILYVNEMKCGISSCFTDFLQLKYYYVQSCFAADSCDRNPEANLLYYEDCNKSHILYQLQKENKLQCFCHPQIYSLWNNQDESSRELIRCLYHYLINGRNLALTSTSLYLHRNTLIYRINKISRILELDLKNLSSNELFYLLFSCAIVEYL